MGQVLGDRELIELVLLRSVERRPGVSSAQLQRAEAILGTPLPALIAQLYLQSNGGWGPGVRPLIVDGDEQGDALKIGNPDKVSIVRHARWRTAMSRLGGGDDQLRWPRGLIALCAWDGGIESTLDVTSTEGRIIRVDPSFFGWQPAMGSGAVPMPAFPTGVVVPASEFVFQIEAQSLQRWLTEWTTRRRAPTDRNVTARANR